MEIIGCLNSFEISKILDQELNFAPSLLLVTLRHCLCILYPISVLPTTLTEDGPNDRHQPSASKLHRFPLILSLEIKPHVDPVCSLVDNLQKDSLVDDIILTIPNCPKQSTNS